MSGSVFLWACVSLSEVGVFVGGGCLSVSVGVCVGHLFPQVFSCTLVLQGLVIGAPGGFVDLCLTSAPPFSVLAAGRRCHHLEAQAFS